MRTPTAVAMGACLVAACCHRIDPGGAEASVLRLSQNDRVLVLAPHPDDEVLCCGGLLQRAVERQLPIRVVFLTLGDSNEWSFLAYRKRPTLTGGQARAMGRLRAEEALQAAERLGVAPEAVSFLGYPDHRGLALFLRAWGDRSPVRGRLTRARAVPYERALRTGAPHRGEEVLEDLGWLLSEFRPTRIFVSHPADHHADHEAFYLFTMVALWEARGEISASVHPYLIHYPAWSLPTGHQPQLGLSPPAQLHATTRWHTFPLSEAEIAGKRHALEAHRTQFGYSARRLLRFVRANDESSKCSPPAAASATRPSPRSARPPARCFLRRALDVAGRTADFSPERGARPLSPGSDTRPSAPSGNRSKSGDASSHRSVSVSL